MTVNRLEYLLNNAKEAYRMLGRLKALKLFDKRVVQRLTALYGVERVHSSGTNYSEALEAMIQQEEALEHYKDYINDIRKPIENAYRIIDNLPDANERMILAMLYIKNTPIAITAKTFHMATAKMTRTKNAIIEKLANIMTEQGE